MRWRVPAGALHCLVTPFDAAGRIDEAVFANLVAFHVAAGAKGLAVALHLGESPSLTIDERRRLAEIAVQAAAGLSPVLVHVADRSTAAQQVLARHADAAGADAIIAPPPYHLALSPREIAAHYHALGQVTRLPIIAYQSPGTCASIDPSTWAMLKAEMPQVAGLKDATLDPGYWRSIGENVLPGVEFPLASRTRSHFSVCAGVAPRLVARLSEAIAPDEARMLQRRMSQLLGLLAPLYPATFKAAMALIGRGVGGVRAPLVSLDAKAVATLSSQLEKLALLADEPRGWKTI